VQAKFFPQHRLFLRYHRESKIIVYAWVNDEDTRRAYESGDEPTAYSGADWNPGARAGSAVISRVPCGLALFRVQTGIM
jgi:hypothetical protein